MLTACPTLPTKRPRKLRLAPHKRRRVNHLPLIAYLIMHVRPGGVAGIAGKRDYISRPHNLARYNQEARVMAVHRHKPAGMIDKNHHAVAATLVSGVFHHSIGGG